MSGGAWNNSILMRGVLPVLESTGPVTVKFGSGVSIPTVLSPESLMSDKVGRFTHGFLTGLAINQGVRCASCSAGRIASNLGSGLHESFSELSTRGGN